MLYSTSLDTRSSFSYFYYLKDTLFHSKVCTVVDLSCISTLPQHTDLKDIKKAIYKYMFEKAQLFSIKQFR